jgi:NAD(P)-dependent dehydrogenase (short-subunit alcohol dehydrogenase family)
MIDMKDKIALMTGAGQGVGQGIALAMAKAGASVVVTGRSPEKLDETCHLIAERGGIARPMTANVKSIEDIARIVADTVATLGGLDILVNNAQEVPLGSLADVSDEAFVAGFESGPLATLRLMKAAHPHLVVRGGGVIFNLVSSAMIRWDMTGYGAYAAVKQAIGSLTRAAAAEWGGDNIRVLNIAPHAESPGMKWWIGSEGIFQDDSARVCRQMRGGYRRRGAGSLRARDALSYRSHDSARWRAGLFRLRDTGYGKDCLCAVGRRERAVVAGTSWRAFGGRRDTNSP